MSEFPPSGAAYPPDDPGEGAPALVRPYARTGGRTKPGRELDLEALVLPTVNGREAWESPLLSPEHNTVLEICQRSVSVAEIAAQLRVPLGVARVIIADMVDLGLVEVLKTAADDHDGRDGLRAHLDRRRARALPLRLARPEPVLVHVGRPRPWRDRCRRARGHPPARGLLRTPGLLRGARAAVRRRRQRLRRHRPAPSRGGARGAAAGPRRSGHGDRRQGPRA